MRPIKGLLFDLDGVIVDTARFHFLAWKRMANELGFDFSEEQNEHLKGISRRESIIRILQWGNLTLPDDKIDEFMTLKNNWYLDYISKMTPADVLPGAADFLRECKSLGYKIALGSASKNALTILDHLSLTNLFDIIVDGNLTTESKPDPQVFLKGAEGLKLAPEECLVFEDAIAGIAAAHNGNMKAIGIGDPSILTAADAVYPGLKDLHINDIISTL